MSTYRFMGEDYELDDPRNEFLCNFVMGDIFTVIPSTKHYEVIHATSPDIVFLTSPSIGKALIAASDPWLTVRRDPDNPPYLLFENDRKHIELLYQHYNDELFHGRCPPVTFKTTTNKKVYGQAVTIKYASGRVVYRLEINKTAMLDRKHFTDVLIHEMIHLFLNEQEQRMLRKGASAEELAYITSHKVHGASFEDMMNSFNRKGYHITKTVEEGEMAKAGITDYYVIFLQSGNQWTSLVAPKAIGKAFKKICDMVTLEKYPFKIKYFKTKEYTFKKVYYNVPENQSLSRNLIESLRWLPMEPNMPFPSKMLGTFEYVPSRMPIPNIDDMPELYILPFADFSNATQKYVSENDAEAQMWLEQAWRKPSASKLDKVYGQYLLRNAGLFRRGSMSAEQGSRFKRVILDGLRPRVTAAAYVKILDKYIDDPILRRALA